MLNSAQMDTPMPPEVTSAEDVPLLSGAIADRHGFVTSADQTRLFYRYWPASTAWNGRVVVVLHGIGYHSAPYKVIADALNPHGTDVYGLDARGHGLSQGRRGFVGTSGEVGADVECMIRFVQQQRLAAKIFLLGDSMGADLALNYAKRNSRELAGLDSSGFGPESGSQPVSKSGDLEPDTLPSAGAPGAGHQSGRQAS
jgi:pimeloyl-ACP methyl ester carboxylesterase